MRGGYQLINLHGHAITAGEAATVKGIYEAVEGNYHKMTIVTGLVLNGVEHNDLPISLDKGESEFTGVMNPQIKDGKLTVLQTTIKDDDTITIAVTEFEGV